MCTVIVSYLHISYSELDDVVVEFVAGMMCSGDCDPDELTEMLVAYIPRVGEIDSLVSAVLIMFRVATPPPLVA